MLYGSGYEAFLPRAVDADRRAARVVGKHCESGDVLLFDAQLPADVAVGDLLAVPVTGAYGHSMGSNYNKVPRPPVVFVADGRARLVVRGDLRRPPGHGRRLTRPAAGRPSAGAPPRGRGRGLVRRRALRGRGSEPSWSATRSVGPLALIGRRARHRRVGAQVRHAEPTGGRPHEPSRPARSAGVRSSTRRSSTATRTGEVVDVGARSRTTRRSARTVRS